MAKYQLVDEVEAHELGSTPEPEWLRTLRADGSVLQSGSEYKVGCPYGWASCYVGDYVIFVEAVTEEGEDEDGNPTVITVTPKSVDVMTKSQFESLYKPAGPSIPSLPEHS